MNNVNWSNVVVGALAVACVVAGVYFAITGYAASVGAIAIAVAINAALLCAHRGKSSAHEPPPKPRRSVPFAEPDTVTGAH